MNFATSMKKYSWMKVVDVMTKEPLTIAATETIEQADELMSENNIRQIPVVAGRTLSVSSPTETFGPSFTVPCSVIPKPGRELCARRSATS